MTEWNDVERAVLGEGVQHADFVRAVHEKHRRLHLYGGFGTFGVVLVWLVTALRLDVGLSAFQVLLGALLAGLVGLGLAGRVSGWGAKRLRKEVWEHCARERVSVEELCALARKMGERWVFFVRLWENEEEVESGSDL